MTIPTLIVPTLFHYDLLQRMLDSVDEAVEHVIVIDNGGSLGRINCAKANKVSVISLPSNLGVGPSWNLGIKLTPFSSWWLICNDDIVWNPGALKLYSEAICDNSIVIGNITSDNTFSGFAVHESVIQTVGLFDEYYYPGVGEEINYIHRMNEAGVSTKMVPNAYSGNKSATRKTLNDKYSKAFYVFTHNIEDSVIRGQRTRGWQLAHRRESDLE